MRFRWASTAPLPDSGSLGEITFSELLFRAAREQRTGTLALRDQAVEKAFTFRKGIVIGSQSNVPAESLAKLSVVRGKTTREALEGLGVPLLNDEKVASALQAWSLMTAADIEEIFRFQLLLRLADVFARTQTGFAWQPAEPVTNPILVNSYQIFTEGIAKRLRPDRLGRDVSELLMEVPVTASNAVFSLDGAALPPRAAQLYRRIDGRSTLSELVDAVNVTVPAEKAADSTYRSWVYLLAFLEGGFVKLLEAGDSAEQTARAPASADTSAESVAPPDGEGSVLVVTEAGGHAVAYKEVEDPVITERYQAMREQDCFELLGLDGQATDGQVKKAYFRLAKEFHPDKLYDHTQRTVKKHADKAFALVNAAYEQLKTSDARKQYQQKLKELAEGLDLDKEAESLLAAEVEFQKGLVFLRQRNYKAAAEQFKLAVELNPREYEHHAYFGWAEFQACYPHDEARWKGALGALDKALEINKKGHEAMFFIGSAKKLLGDLDESEKMFTQVLRYRPNHIEAQRELRLMEQRRVKAATTKTKS